MQRKSQRAWAIVGGRGWIDHSSIRYTRKAAIADHVAEFRKYRWGEQFAPMTDTQFWRKLKATRGFRCRRVTLRVSR